MIYLRQAGPKDLRAIMAIIQEARLFLANSGSDQWQGVYPAVADIEHDFEQAQGYVLVVDQVIAGYCALIPGEDPAYTQIKNGAWSNPNLDYIAIHRIALADAFRGRALTRYLFTAIFSLMTAQGYRDFRVDTHPLNQVMQRVFEREGFIQKGLVEIEGERLAYQLEVEK
ncbi:GNAT family N-acetyltransferase [Lactococcus taiwanensis]|uniref:GNAT family N-acetyltransferase n=1 Tax=Lactococcus taiwanensis TaxID=1151742 RepID=UPI0007B187EA|nr:GNAT family N-acetyltransferase [Lactococcus taiwanensis]KZK36240.1 Histone acetyltransferase HPA2 [Lactococcus cremoris]